MPTLVIIDDDQEERTEIAELVTRALGSEVNVVAFSDDEAKLVKKESYEQFLLGRFEIIQPSFIVCDKELGKYENLQGLSANPVSSVAADLGIPFCLYSRQGDDAARDFEKYKRLRKWSTDEITLDGGNPNEWSEKIVKIFKGFNAIKDSYANSTDKTPAAALAKILDFPDAEPRIALYGSGEQSFLMETLSFFDESEQNIEDLRNRMPRVLGNWLLLSLLRFPGIFVNKIAASSYLNIDQESFADPKIKDAFSSAQYEGPFSDLEDWWWRDKLDTILDEKGAEDGLALVTEMGLQAKPCIDAEGNRAGYFCMITKTPVSPENSSGNISWFPSGADLARIRKDKFDQITSLVGMY